MTVRENAQKQILDLRCLLDHIQDLAPHRPHGPLNRPYSNWCNFLMKEILELEAILPALAGRDPAPNGVLAIAKPEVGPATNLPHQPTLPEASESNPGASIMNHPRSKPITQLQHFIDRHKDWLEL